MQVQIRENYTALGDFDNSTGIVSNVSSVSTSANKPYGVEFSLSSQILYVSYIATGNIEQIDIATSSIVSIGTINKGGTDNVGSLQLAPDGKIYCAGGYFANYTQLHVIENPDIVGIGSNLINDVINLSPGVVKLGFHESRCSACACG